MRVGLEIGAFAWEGGPARTTDTLVSLARSADDAGFTLLGVGDHLWQGDHAGGPEQPHLECFGTLGLLAAHTTRVRLAPVVAGVHFRHPAVLAKAVTTLDVLSGGRAMLGIGAGWYAAEALGMGVPFPPLADRFAMVEETIQVCLRLWHGRHGDQRPFTGRFYRLDRPVNAPQSLTRPHPPILIGGDGERRTLRLVARYADACNLYAGPDLSAKLDVLRRHCDAEGRDYDTIEKTCIFPVDVGPDADKVDELVGQVRRLGGLGVQTAILIVSGPDPVRQVDAIGERVVPEVADV